MDRPKDVGDRTTLAVMLALQEAGYVIFVPFGETVGATSSLTMASRSSVFNAKPEDSARALSVSRSAAVMAATFDPAKPGATITGRSIISESIVPAYRVCT
jgi:hypothetical protein